MRVNVIATRTGLRPIVLVATLVGVAACARPMAIRNAPMSAGTAIPSIGTIVSSPGSDSTTIEVREYPYSPNVAVVGWTADETGLGLRTSVRREGTIATDHHLYISTYYTPAARQFNRAATIAGPLELTGLERDTQSCTEGRRVCSPFMTFGARIPDKVLRANRDSIAVTFYARDGGELAVTVHRELIDAYLGVVDSVSASFKKK